MVTIEAKLREKTGKGNARKLRKLGLLPANLVIAGKATNLELNPKFLSKAYKDNRKFELDFNGKKTLVHIQEVHIDPVKRIPLHVDLIPAK